MPKVSRHLSIELTALHKTESQVSFSYSAFNASGKMAYIFNFLPAAAKIGKVTIDNKRTYAQLNDNTLVVSKRLFEVPEDLDVLAPEVPFLSELHPGEKFQDSIALDLPVHEDYPYAKRRLAGQPEQRRNCNSLVFLLGFLSPPDPEWVIKTIIDGREVFTTDYGFAIQMNLIASSEPVALNVECILA